MCPQLGYEADTGVEVPPTGLTPVEERRVHSAVSPSHSYLAFFFGGFWTLKLWVEGTTVDHTSSGWSVRCCVFQGCDVDVEIFEIGFERVFVALALSSDLSSITTESTMPQLLGYTGVWHSKNVTRPSCLCLAHGVDYASEFSPLQQLSVGDLVLPAVLTILRRHRRWNFWSCTNQLLCHCVFICSNFRQWLVYYMRWLLWCFCLLAESYEMINHYHSMLPANAPGFTALEKCC